MKIAWIGAGGLGFAQNFIRDILLTESLSGSELMLMDIFRVIALDQLTAAVCSLEEIKSMTDELFETLKDKIEPEFSC